MSIPGVFDCECTVFLICPYCGYEHKSIRNQVSDCFAGKERWYACEKCHKTFSYEYEFQVHFSSRKEYL
jgi:transposase-like protein